MQGFSACSLPEDGGKLNKRMPNGRAAFCPLKIAGEMTPRNCVTCTHYIFTGYSDYRCYQNSDWEKCKDIGCRQWRKRPERPHTEDMGK